MVELNMALMGMQEYAPVWEATDGYIFDWNGHSDFDMANARRGLFKAARIHYKRGEDGFCVKEGGKVLLKEGLHVNLYAFRNDALNAYKAVLAACKGSRLTLTLYLYNDEAGHFFQTEIPLEEMPWESLIENRLSSSLPS